MLIKYLQVHEYHTLRIGTGAFQSEGIGHIFRGAGLRTVTLSDFSHNASRQSRESVCAGRSRVAGCLASELEEGQDEGRCCLDGETVLHDNTTRISKHMHCNAFKRQFRQTAINSATSVDTLPACQPGHFWNIEIRKGQLSMQELIRTYYIVPHNARNTARSGKHLCVKVCRGHCWVVLPHARGHLQWRRVQIVRGSAHKRVLDLGHACVRLQDRSQCR